MSRTPCSLALCIASLFAPACQPKSHEAQSLAVSGPGRYKVCSDDGKLNVRDDALGSVVRVLNQGDQVEVLGPSKSNANGTKYFQVSILADGQKGWAAGNLLCPAGGGHDVIPGALFCPSGMSLVSVGSEGGKICANERDAAGPFPKEMIDECIRFSGDTAENRAICGGNRWGRDFAINIRGKSRCPKGTRFDGRLSICTDFSDTNAFGPFPANVVDACVASTNDRPTCEGMRFGRNITASWMGKSVEGYTSLENKLKQKGMVDVAGTPGVIVNLAYATPFNFTGQNVYGTMGLWHCFLQPSVASKVKKAAATLQQSGYRLVMLDCGRPHSVQAKFHEIEPDTSKVGWPRSIHNYGGAVDVTLEKDGVIFLKEQMGTIFDDFAAGAPIQTDAESRITEAQRHNRARVLRPAMTGANLAQFAGEWWHYDGIDRNQRSEEDFIGF